MIKNPTLTKNFKAGGAIGKHLIVKFGADDQTVVAAAAVADFIFGVNEGLDVANGERADVIVGGIAPVVYGGAVTRGAQLTTDANGKAVVAAPAAGANNRIIGVAMESGVLNDIGAVLLQPGSMQG